MDFRFRATTMMTYLYPSLLWLRNWLRTEDVYCFRGRRLAEIKIPQDLILSVALCAKTKF